MDFPALICVCLLAADPAAIVSGRPDPPVAATNQRVPIAVALSPSGYLSCRPAAAREYQVVAENDQLHATDRVVAFPGASFRTTNKKVTVTAGGDWEGRSPLPVFETAFYLTASDDVDMDMTLECGRVEVRNTSSEGGIRVRLRFWDQTWTAVLEGPEHQLLLEVSARWPAGTRFRPPMPPGNPATMPQPVANAGLIWLRGSGMVDVGGAAMAMSAPPGPAELRWDSLTGVADRPLKLERLPEWVPNDAVRTEQGRKIADALRRLCQARVAEPNTAIRNFLDAQDPTERRVALVALGALDDLDTLGRALVAAKSLDEWDFGIGVLRHWLARSPGQVPRYYEFLTQIRGYSPTEATIILQLLFGFSAEDLRQAETYEVLVDYLIHEKPAIRNLAAWHLVRLIPEGRKIPYRPDGTRTDAIAAQQQWRQLISSLPLSRKEN